MKEIQVEKQVLKRVTKQVTYYITSDEQPFTDKAAAENHENELVLESSLKKEFKVTDTIKFESPFEEKLCSQDMRDISIVHVQREVDWDIEEKYREDNICGVSKLFHHLHFNTDKRTGWFVIVEMVDSTYSHEVFDLDTVKSHYKVILEKLEKITQ